MVNVITEIIIDRPINEVAQYAADPNNAMEWYKNIISVQWKTPKPITLNSKIAFKAKFLGKNLSYTYEVVYFDPIQKLVMKTKEGPFPMMTTYSWSKIDENTTRMILTNKGNPKGFSKLFAPFMELMMKSANKKDLKKLKEILEN